MENSTVAKDLSCMASSCLLSLVIALGETSKMLAAVASLLIAPSGISDGIVKVSLLCSVQDYILVKKNELHSKSYFKLFF